MTAGMNLQVDCLEDTANLHR